MARQEIDLTTPQPNGKMGEPTKSAWEKVNDMTLDLYASAEVADAALPSSGGNLTGAINRVNAVLGEYSYRIYNVTTNSPGIGGSFSTWNSTRTPGLQVDAQVSTNAYMPVRVTQWGTRHLFAIDVYAGGTNSSTVETCFHMADSQRTHVFFSNGNAIFAGTLTQNSDYRIKRNVDYIDPSEAANAMRGVRAVEYNDISRNDDSPRRAGVLAHELQEQFPLLVSGVKDETHSVTVMQGDTTPYAPGTEPEGYSPPVEVEAVVPKLQSVNYAGMTPYLAAAWQEHDSRVYALEKEVFRLKEIISKIIER